VNREATRPLFFVLLDCLQTAALTEQQKFQRQGFQEQLAPVLAPLAAEILFQEGLGVGFLQP
jgi:hypothetical protein